MSSERELARSRNYRVVSEWETVRLLKNDNSLSVTIGDFYGDPECGVIDEGETWCVTAGCGIIVYYLKKPFLEYECDRKTGQWSEFGRDPEDIWWVSSIRQYDGQHVEFTLDGDPTKKYIMNVNSLHVRADT